MDTKQKQDIETKTELVNKNRHKLMAISEATKHVEGAM